MCAPTRPYVLFVCCKAVCFCADLRAICDRLWATKLGLYIQILPKDKIPFTSKLCMMGPDLNSSWQAVVGPKMIKDRAKGSQHDTN